jgi:hypothetical protein
LLPRAAWRAAAEFDDEAQPAQSLHRRGLMHIWLCSGSAFGTTGGAAGTVYSPLGPWRMRKACEH